MKSKKEILFLVAILLAGLLTVTGYGACLDQAAQQRILFGNVREYLLHLPGEVPPLAQEIGDSGILESSIDEDRDHGMACFYPVFWLWYVNKVSPFAGSIIWQIYNFLLVFGGICSLYLLGKELFHSRYIAGFTALLFFLTPRMFAESHYNNKDVILCALSFSMFYWCLRLMREASVKSVVCFAFVGALAFNIKLLGAWIFGVLGLYALAWFIASGKFNLRILGKALGCIVLWLVFYILLTPASWSGIVEFFRYNIEYALNYDLWHDYVLFDGKMIHKDYTGMPRRYLPTMILITTPVLILLLTAGGFLFSVRDAVKDRLRALWSEAGYVLCILIIGIVPAGYAVLAATPLYNGWRHLYFIYASMIVGAGYCCSRVHSLLAGGKKQRILEMGGALYLLVLALGIALNYPNEHSYYNLLAGSNVVERYELDYWDISVKEALDAIWKEEKGKGQITVGALNNPTRWGIGDQLSYFPSAKKEAFTLAENWEDSEWLIVNTTYAVMYSGGEYETVRESYELVKKFSSYGNVICELWKR